MVIGKSVLSVQAQRIDGFADPDAVQFPTASHLLETLAVTAGFEETLVGITSKQAEAILAKRKAAVVAGEYLPSGDMTMAFILQNYFARPDGFVLNKIGNSSCARAFFTHNYAGVN